MISLIEGVAVRKGPDYLVLQTAGIGFTVYASMRTLNTIGINGNPVTLEIHTHIAQDSIKLYGFHSRLDLQVFEMLIAVNKIGPKIALTMLSHLDAHSILIACRDNDSNRLLAIPGIGRKTIDRILIETKQTAIQLFELHHLQDCGLNPAYFDAELQDILDALIGLGFRPAEAQQSINIVLKNSGERLNSTLILREALKHLRQHMSSHRE